MATIKMTGLEGYISRLNKLGRDAVGICKASVYEGADEVADAVRAAIEALPTESYGDTMADWRDRRPVDAITDKQKQGLLDSLYVERIRDEDGFVFTRIGFAGYNDVKTATYPNGQPNSMIARAIESGSSARRKHPFIRPAVNRVKTAAIARMQQQLTNMIDNIEGGK